MRHRQTLLEQRQRHTRHDARRDREHASVHPLARCPHACAPSDLEPQRRHACAKRLADATEQGAPEHGFPAGANGEIERERHCEAFGDVVDEEGHEDGEAEVRVCVVGGKGDETFGKFVEGDGDGGLETDGEEGVSGDMVVMLVLRGGRVMVVRRGFLGIFVIE